MIDVTLISFFVLAVASVASALGVIFFKNAVHSALSLILTLLFLALFYLQLGAMFIAIVQILIYAGAIDDKATADPADIAKARNYVRDALNEGMAGKPVDTPLTKPYGCSVKY